MGYKKKNYRPHTQRKIEVPKIIPFSSLSENEQTEFENKYHLDDNAFNNPLKAEIEKLSVELDKYNIDFEELVLCSPKAKKTSLACKEAIKYIIDNPAILNQVNEKLRLPIKEIEKECKLPRKLLDRHRKYIIAVVKILTGNYVYLQEYVSSIKGGKDI